MITELVTKEKMDQWKEYFKQYASSILPNRKTGWEIDEYFRKKYPYQTLKSEEFRTVAEEKVMANEYSREKLSPGTKPLIKTYLVENVYVGIDIVSGEFHVECEDMKKAISIFDDLFLYRGLDETDLKNFVMVGQFLEIADKKNMSLHLYKEKVEGGSEV